MVEIAEGIVLAIVAITTAWSGYQAALWAGHQSELYALASKQRVQAEQKPPPTTERLYNAATVAQWLQAWRAWTNRKSDGLRFIGEMNDVSERYCSSPFDMMPEGHGFRIDMRLCANQTDPVPAAPQLGVIPCAQLELSVLWISYVPHQATSAGDV